MNNNQFDELAKLARNLFIWISLVSGVLIMSIAFLFASDANVRDPAIKNWQAAIGIEILIAIGTSIVSSIIFYALYSRTAEENVLKNITKVSVDYATSLFTKRFDKMLPSNVFPAEGLPTNEFDQCFYPILKSSKTYKFKGDIAKFTSFRLAQILDGSYFLEKEYILLLLDPREHKLFEKRAKVELSKYDNRFSRARLTEETETLQVDVFVTLTVLFDIRHRISVNVAFHKEPLFFVSEFLDEGLFLTYYLGSEFPGTYLYAKSTLAYEAYLQNFRQSYDISSYHICFDNELEEADFSTHLNTLGCKLDIEELRQLRDKRFEKYRKVVTRKQ